MKKISFPSCLFLFTVLISNITRADINSDLITRCFRGTSPFFENIKALGAAPVESVQAMMKTCFELEYKPLMFEPLSLSEQVVNELIAKGIFGVTGHALSAFSRLQGNNFEKQYMQRLSEIKKIPNPMVRIRSTYELVVENQGFYDHKKGGVDGLISGYVFAAETPGNLLQNANDNGTVGVCREMASLLQWSLLQVARHSQSNSMALGPSDFSSTFIGGMVPGDEGWGDGGGHAWVRVNIPEFDTFGRLSGFRNFDLDTTFNGNFSVLVPRRSQRSKEDRLALIEDCHQIVRCIVP